MRLRVQSLASRTGLRIRRYRELWRRLVATAPIRPLAWEPPYAAGAAQEMAKRQKKEKRDSHLLRAVTARHMLKHFT